MTILGGKVDFYSLLLPSHMNENLEIRAEPSSATSKMQ